MPRESGSSTLRPMVAVFDFDGTSIEGQSGALFTRYLLSEGMMTSGDFAGLLWWGLRYKLHLPYRQDEARELVFRGLSHLSSGEVDALMARFHDEVLAPRYRPMALAEVARCHDEGLTVLLVSATFAPIARLACARMGADGYVATKMARDDRGRYTGLVDGPVIAGPEKCRAVKTWCDERFGAGSWELRRVYADHHTDIDLLEMAAEPYAVCPGKTLGVSARRRGWPILDWEC